MNIENSPFWLQVFALYTLYGFCALIGEFVRTEESIENPIPLQESIQGLLIFIIIGNDERDFLSDLLDRIGFLITMIIMIMFWPIAFLINISGKRESFNQLIGNFYDLNFKQKDWISF